MTTSFIAFLSFEHKLHTQHERDTFLPITLVLNPWRGTKELYLFVLLASPLPLILGLFLSIDTVMYSHNQNSQEQQEVSEEKLINLFQAN